MGWHAANPLPWQSLAAGLPWEMALAQVCSAAGQLGPAQQGGTDPGSRQHRSPGGAALLPPSPLLPSLRVPLPPRAAPSPLPRPAHTGDCVLDGDTDPCQSQLGEINTPGLKGLHAPGEGVGCDSRAPCPAVLASVGHHVPEQPMGSAHPGTACSQPEQAGACLAVPHSLPRPEPCCPGGTGGCGAETAPPTCCPAQGCGGGLRCAPACTAASFPLPRGVCVKPGVLHLAAGGLHLARGLPGPGCLWPGQAKQATRASQVLPRSCYTASPSR